MSDLDTYPDVLIRDRNNMEAERKHAMAINRIKHNLATVEDVMTLQAMIAREFGILDENLGQFAGGAIIINWSAGNTVSTDSQMTVDAAAGSFTIGASGLYQVIGQFILTGSANNLDLEFNAHINGGVGQRLAYVFQPSQAADAQLNINGYVWLLAGEVATFSVTGTALYTLEDSQISLQMKIPGTP